MSNILFSVELSDHRTAYFYDKERGWKTVVFVSKRDRQSGLANKPYVGMPKYEWLWVASKNSMAMVGDPELTPQDWTAIHEGYIAWMAKAAFE